MRRARRGESNRFLPLADIFTSAMACILLLFVISSRVQQVEPYRVPQADIVFACQQSRSLSAPPVDPAQQAEAIDLFVRVDREPGQAMDADAFAAELRQMSPPGRLSLRLRLEVADDDRSCQELATKIVERLNAAYETTAAPAAKAVPGAYLLLDTVRLEAPRSRSK